MQSNGILKVESIKQLVAEILNTPKTPLLLILPSLFWYLSLFPGRLGADGSAAISLIQRGESTNWWTSTFFWFLKISTFNGQQIWLTSLILLVTLFISINYFLNSLHLAPSLKMKLIFIVTATPFYGNFGLNVSHDVFTSSGVLLLTGYSFREYLHKKKAQKTDLGILVFASIILSNSITGLFLIFLFLLFHFFRQAYRFQALCALLVTIAVYVISSFGVTKTETPMYKLPIIADIKCVVQHKSTLIDDEKWQTLLLMADRDTWEKPKSCASVDSALEEIDSVSLRKVDMAELLSAYISIAFKYPEIVIYSHIQRASVALPPPFFFGPKNMIENDPSKPIGVDTNFALQSGPMVFHPSVDLKSLQIHNKYLRIFEAMALLPGFLINQASWFWGWGGLWLWPIFLYLILFEKSLTWKKLIFCLHPILLSHFFLLLVSPISAPRYVLSTIIIGIVCLILILERTVRAVRSKI